MVNIGSYSFEEYLEMVEFFHGAVAPGLVLGGFMVDLAIGRISEGALLDAICETRTCLPDAIQLLTPCTIGNGWLKVFDLGRFALSLYEKKEGRGVRVYLDTKKLESWPEIKSWLFKLKPKTEQDKDLLLAQMKEAGNGICGVQSVQIQPQYLMKQSLGKIAVCSECSEPYPVKDGIICRGCQGEAPYVSGLTAVDAGPEESSA